MDLTGRNFLTLKDFTSKEIIGLLDLADDLKKKKKKLEKKKKKLKKKKKKKEI